MATWRGGRRRQPAVGGRGLRDTTRLAASQAAVWQSDARQQHARRSTPLLRALAAELERAVAIDLDDRDAVRASLRRGHRAQVFLIL